MVENIVVGSYVWVGDPELVWVAGQVVHINGEDAEILTTNGKMVLKFLSFFIFFLIFLWFFFFLFVYILVIVSYIFSQAVVKVSKIYPKDVEALADGVDDMTKLSYLHEPGVLHNLATRFASNEIYV